MNTQTLNSIGHVCTLLQRTHGKVKTAIKALAIEPVAVVNGVEHFSDNQVERIATKLREVRNA